MNGLASEFPDVELSHMYVDNAAMQLIRNPKQVFSFLHETWVFELIVHMMLHDIYHQLIFLNIICSLILL